jgi:hypothetical protein
VFSFEDGPDSILVPYALELPRDALDIQDINCAKRLFLLFLLTTTPLGPDNRINEAL